MLTTCIVLVLSQPAYATKGEYQTQEQFLAQVYKEQSPEVKLLWLTADDNAQIAEILSHASNRLRIRYWQIENSRVWILDEIGKEKPITVAIHINNSQIITLKVLTFRESRGDEVRHEFFTDQFKNTHLKADNNLSNNIDGITGATLSVRALTKTARLALWLDQKVKQG